MISDSEDDDGSGDDDVCGRDEDGGVVVVTNFHGESGPVNDVLRTLLGISAPPEIHLHSLELPMQATLPNHIFSLQADLHWG